jgi:2-C-methyl-D-erythritol 4-phosphate cytidylyltransferase
VVPAGGTGSRMHAAIPKQYLRVDGRPVIEHTLERICQSASVDQVVIGIAQADLNWAELEYNNQKLVAVVAAGTERSDTVEKCLQYIVEQGGEGDWALVHDAARPCVRDADIKRLVDSVIGHADGGILALPLSDTIKRGGRNPAASVILETVPREGLWRAMTPQLFKVGELLSAILQARVNGVSLTDEASAMEETAAKIVLVPCSPDNIKITLPQDIQFAEMILRAQQHEANDLPE